ncbi:hypothetical protein HMPREF0731_2607, partial [Pseudoroseomonas cervicalis ATCC 49957]
EAQLRRAGQRQQPARRAVEAKLARGDHRHQPAAPWRHLQRQGGAAGGGRLHRGLVRHAAGGLVGHRVGGAGQDPGAEAVLGPGRHGGADADKSEGEGGESAHAAQHRKPKGNPP